MKIENISLKDSKFLTTDANCGNNPLLLVNHILEVKCVDGVPRAFKALDIVNENVPLYNLSNGMQIEKDDLDDNTYVVVDGKEIITSALYINRMAATDAKTTSGVPNNFTIDSLNLLLLEVDDLHGRTLAQYCSDIHKEIDVTDNPLSELQRDQNLAVMHLLKDAGLSIPCMSRYLTFNSKTLTEQMLVKGEQQTLLSTYDFSCGMKIITTLLNAGFSLKFLKKACMTDYIMDEYRIGRLNDCLAMLSGMDRKEIEYLETMVPIGEVKTFLGHKTTDFVNSHPLRKNIVAHTTTSEFYDVSSLYNSLVAAINIEKGRSKSRPNQLGETTLAKTARRLDEYSMWTQVSKVKKMLSEDTHKTQTLPIIAHHEVTPTKLDGDEKYAPQANVPIEENDYKGNEDIKKLQDNNIKVLEVMPNSGSSATNSDFEPGLDFIGNILSEAMSSASLHNKLSGTMVIKKEQSMPSSSNAAYISNNQENDISSNYAPPLSNFG